MPDPIDQLSAGSSGGGAPAQSQNSTGGSASTGTASHSTGAPASSGGSTGSAGSTGGGAPQWPANWRESYAGADDKKLQRLQRYASPQAALDALFAAQARIASGELKTALPKDATVEQIAQWRAENGIPDSPEKYDLNIEGVTLEEADKAVLGEFAKAAHAANMTPEQLKAAAKFHFEMQEKQAEQRQQLDLQAKETAEEALRAEWGADYKRNQTLIKNLLASGPEGMADQVLGARGPDGTPFASNPDILRWLISMSLQINPQATILPTGGGDMVQSVNDEIKKIETFMRTNRADYNKDEAMQKRLRELYAYRDRQTAKT